MRLTLVISSLSCGGAERVMSMMANYWAENGADVTLVTLVTLGPEDTDFYALVPKVRRVGLGLTAESADPWTALKNNLRRLKRLRSALVASRPEVVISFIHSVNVLTLLAMTGTGVPVVVAERTDPYSHPLGRAWSALRRLLYPRAAAVVTQSESASQWARKFVPKDLVYRLPNPVRKPSPANKSETSSATGRTVLAVGRLSPVKGFDLLIRAFASCVPRHPDWSLTVLGEGPERDRLEALATELEISDRLNLPGQIEDPERTLGSADLFVLSSRYEGFPNALLEAMASGLAAVSFDCPNGPAEIIEDGVDGVLVERENVDALAATMSHL
ncbi:MAG: glycosyltransferase family 4 protein, partial [Rubrobacteraceae bacterium]